MVLDIRWSTVLVLGFVVCEGYASAGVAESTLRFPAGFRFGAATAAYQVEGAWNVSDKSPSIWDVYTHTQPQRMADRATGDVASDSYHLWKRDVEIASELGLDFYRFSISWPRVLPNGFTNKVSEDGMKYYHDLIELLLATGIQPAVTLYHFDLPQRLQDLGGWNNPLIVDWYTDFARVMFTRFGDRVHTWYTFNEPATFCVVPTNAGWHAPGLRDPGIADYLCSKHVLLAHAKAWRLYDTEFRPRFHGRVSIVNHILWYEGKTGSDEVHAELARELLVGMYSHPIFSEQGGWPPVIKELIAENSKNQGYPCSRLPDFTDEEIKLVRGTYDFYGINLYTARTVRKAEVGEPVGPWFLNGSPELNLVFEVRPEWRSTSTSWLYVYPEALRKQLKWLQKEYGDIEYVVTENGYSSDGREFNDLDRIDYLRDYMKQILLSIYEDSVNVTGYTVWSMIDNLEWSDGYRPHFGLYAVDFASDQRTRTARASGRYYGAVTRARSLLVSVPTAAAPRRKHSTDILFVLYGIIQSLLN